MTSFVRGVEDSQVTRVVTLRAFRRKCAQVVFEVTPTKGNIVPISSLCPGHVLNCLLSHRREPVCR